MTPDGSQLLGEGHVVFHEPEKHPTIEGPKFYKHDGWYYILAPAGGVENGWQVALRSRKIYGPYEDKIVLAQGSTAVNGPHQGALVDSPDDGWWFVHFQDAGIYGRVTHLQPVRWENGWPVMGANGEPVMRHARLRTSLPQKIATPSTSDEFDVARLGLQWQWNANHLEEWCSLSARPGWLRLFAQPATTELNLLPNLLLQKFPARSFVVETLLDVASLPAGGEGGLVIAGTSYASLSLRCTGGGGELRLRRDHVETMVRAGLSGNIRLRITVREGGHCEFSFAAGGELIVLPEKFAAAKGVWIGAKTGIYATHPHRTAAGGHVDFDYFRFAPETPA
jgi:hypothetical protein